MSFEWTDERIAALKKLYGDGLSASKIADALGCESRNAVIGKIHRLGLSGRARAAAVAKKTEPRKRGQKGDHGGGMVQRIRLRAERQAKEVAKPAPAPAPKVKRATLISAPSIEAGEIIGIPLVDLPSNGCRFAVTPDTAAPGEHLFCGAVRVTGEPYCAAHCRRAYNVSPRISDEERERRRAWGAEMARANKRRGIGAWGAA